MLTTLFTMCAIVGSSVLVIQFLLSLLGVGIGADADLDIDLPSNDVDGIDTVSDGNWAFAKYLSLQTIVAFVAFFGIGGLIADKSGQPPVVSSAVALITGTAIMVGYGHLVHSMRKLETDGSFRIELAEGAHGRVYLRIPGEQAGAGKVTVIVQGRTVELSAMTEGPELRTGTSIVINRILDRQTVQVVRDESPVRSTTSA